LADETTNNTITQEQYDQLKVELEAQVEAEKARAKEAVAQATQPLNERITELEGGLQSKDEEITTLKTEGETRDGSLTQLQATLDGALTEYRSLVVSANPLFSEELIQGNTLDEIKASVEKANAVVGKVKAGLESQANLTTIPAGAPAATPVDLSTLSSREKITRGLQEARKEK